MARALRGSSIARRCVGVGTEANPGTRASGEARPTGVVLSVEASSGEGPSWVEHGSTLRWHGHRGESRNAGVGQCPTHGIASSADASRSEALRGSSIARRCVGVGTEANPGTRASGEARPTGRVLSAEASSGEGPPWVEHRSTLRWRGHSDESRRAGVGQCPTHGIASSADASRSEALRGSSTARRCVGVGTEANPGTQASGSARPTGVVLSAAGSDGEVVRGSSIARRCVGVVSATNFRAGSASPQRTPTSKQTAATRDPAVPAHESFTVRSDWASSDARTPPRRTSLGTRRPAAPHRGPTPPSPTRAARFPSPRACR